MTRPVEKKFFVKPNTQIKDVYTKLNSVQKQMVNLYDFDKDGVLNKIESQIFNKTIFSENKESIDCYNTNQNGKKCKVAVPKNDKNSNSILCFINGMI